ncbi:MAG TPA: thiamine pyrophosphate-dependent dehydrogenase E1 component subunit alpha [Thermodesulfobacteriota bacterium]|nr:thiamine pyrophosphate-dependent dehydrogenase E1 component subunit alpha [Thermodesulfobacteriota bacterium]
MALHEEVAIRIYRDMVRTRALDEQMIKNSRGGIMRAGWHSGLGEETIVAPISLLNREDYVTYTHRGAYVWIAKGMDMKEIIAEFYGKATGCSKGKGGTHIAKPSLGIFGRAGSQGGHFVLATGMALAAKMRGSGQIVISCFGDGCGTRGTLHESMNYASIHKLPILWLCENNGYSVTVSVDKLWPIEDLSNIAANYAMPGKTVDGTDVVAVTEAAQEFVARARRGEGPSLLEMKFYRWRAHVEGTTTAYMRKEEVETWKKKDPIMRFEQVLAKQNILKEREILKVKAEAETEVQEAQRFAENSPDPPPEDGLDDLYADSHT